MAIKENIAHIVSGLVITLPLAVDAAELFRDILVARKRADAELDGLVMQYNVFLESLENPQHTAYEGDAQELYAAFRVLQPTPVSKNPTLRAQNGRGLCARNVQQSDS